MSDIQTMNKGGRLIQPPNVTVLIPLVGLMKREQRLYLLYSIACQRNPDQKRAQRLIARTLNENGRILLGS